MPEVFGATTVPQQITACAGMGSAKGSVYSVNDMQVKNFFEDGRRPHTAAGAR
jgi:hypothetical protein